MKKIMFFLLMLCSHGSFGQAETIAETEKNHSYIFEESFEIIPKGKIKEIFTSDIKFEIESRRHDSNYIDWDATEYSIIRIFPRRVLKPENLNTIK